MNDRLDTYTTVGLQPREAPREERSIGTLPIDWRFPPAGLRVPVILAADLTYETRNIDPLVRFIKHVLEPGGVCLLTDQDRTPAPLLREALGYAGLRYEQEVVRAGEPGGYRVQGTLYRIRHR